MNSDLKTIPGIGKAIKEHLIAIGYKTVDSLKNEDPNKLYDLHNKRVGYIEDRCLLYTLRCAVYYAGNEIHDKEKLKWWNWKDK